MNAINFKIPFLIEQDDPKMNKKDELAHCHNSFEIIKILEGQYIYVMYLVKILLPIKVIFALLIVHVSIVF